MKKVGWFFLRFIAVSLCLTYLIVVDQNPSKVVELIVTTLFGVAATSLISSLAGSWGGARLTLHLLFLAMLLRELRISFAALLIVRSGDDLMLVHSSKHSQFQPIGGVYKFFDRTIRPKFGLSDDDMKKPNVDELRLRFKKVNVWLVFGFLDWFRTRQGRESDPHREFGEELISTGILPAREFSDVAFEFKKTVVPPIRISPALKVHELFAWEIFEARLTPKQQSIIDGLKMANDPRFCFMRAKQIENDGYDGQRTVKIGSHTKELL